MVFLLVKRKIISGRAMMAIVALIAILQAHAIYSPDTSDESFCLI